MSVERSPSEYIKQPLSEDMDKFLKEKEHASNLDAIIDAAREVGIEDFTSTDAALTMEIEDNYGNE